MSVGFVIFCMVWAPLVCLVSAFVGAYLVWCKQHNANPVQNIRSYFAPEEPSVKKEEEIGFYER